MYVMEDNNIFLGNKEVVIGGWGEYEINKRCLRAEISKEKYNNYYNSKYIYPQNVIDSVLKNSAIHFITHDTIKSFINVLKKEENKNDNFTDIWVLPKLTSSILDDYLDTNMYDPDEMQKINLMLMEYCDLMNINISLEILTQVPLITIKPVHVTNIDGIIELEKQMIPIINIIEKNIGILALNCDRIKKYILNIDDDIYCNKELDNNDKDNIMKFIISS